MGKFGWDYPAGVTSADIDALFDAGMEVDDMSEEEWIWYDLENNIYGWLQYNLPYHRSKIDTSCDQIMLAAMNG